MGGALRSRAKSTGPIELDLCFFFFFFLCFLGGGVIVGGRIWVDSIWSLVAVLRLVGQRRKVESTSTSTLTSTSTTAATAPSLSSSSTILLEYGSAFVERIKGEVFSIFESAFSELRQSLADKDAKSTRAKAAAALIATASEVRATDGWKEGKKNMDTCIIYVSLFCDVNR